MDTVCNVLCVLISQNIPSDKRIGVLTTLTNNDYEKVHEGNDQEMVQSERKSHSKNQGGKN